MFNDDILLPIKYASILQTFSKGFSQLHYFFANIFKQAAVSSPVFEYPDAPITMKNDMIRHP